MKESDRKKYEKPTMRVYPLKKQPQLLVGSGDGNQGNRNPYGDPTNWNWN